MRVHVVVRTDQIVCSLPVSLTYRNHCGWTGVSVFETFPLIKMNSTSVSRHDSESYRHVLSPCPRIGSDVCKKL